MGNSRGAWRTSSVAAGATALLLLATTTIATSTATPTQSTTYDQARQTQQHYQRRQQQQQRLQQAEHISSDSAAEQKYIWLSHQEDSNETAFDAGGDDNATIGSLPEWRIDPYTHFSRSTEHPCWQQPVESVAESAARGIVPSSEGGPDSQNKEQSVREDVSEGSRALRAGGGARRLSQLFGFNAGLFGVFAQQVNSNRFAVPFFPGVLQGQPNPAASFALPVTFQLPGTPSPSQSPIPPEAGEQQQPPPPPQEEPAEVGPPSGACQQEFEDTVVEVSDTTKPPFSGIGEIYNREGGRCSASLVGRCHLVTAAHCVYNFTTSTLNSDWIFVPAVTGDNAPLGSTRAKKVEIPRQVTQSLDASYDVALMALQDNIGDRAGYFEHISKSPPLPSDCVLNHAGYPYQGRMFYQHCRITGTIDNNRFVSTDCVGRQGVSGGPMWTLDATTKRRNLRAVLTAGADYGAKTGAIKLDDELWELLEGWISANPC